MTQRTKNLKKMGEILQRHQIETRDTDRVTRWWNDFFFFELTMMMMPSSNAGSSSIIPMLGAVMLNEKKKVSDTCLSPVLKFWWMPSAVEWILRPMYVQKLIVGAITFSIPNGTPSFRRYDSNPPGWIREARMLCHQAKPQRIFDRSPQ